MNHLVDRSLRWLTANPLERRNVAWFVVSDVLTMAGAAFFAGHVLQAYLLRVGFENRQLGQVAFVGEIAAAAALFAFMGLADRIERRVRAVMLLSLAAVLTPLVLCFLSLLPADRVTVGVVLGTVLVLLVIRRCLGAFHGMVHSGLIVRALHVRIRGRFTGIQGFIAGAAVMVVGVGSAKALGFGYPRGFTVCFAAAIPLIVGGALSIRKVAELAELKSAGRAGSASPLAATWDLLKLREFRILIVPNALQGIAFSVGFFLVSIGKTAVSLPDEYVGYMVAVDSATAVGAYVVMGWMVDRSGPGVVVMLGYVLAAAGLGWMILAPSANVYLAACAVFFFGITSTCIGVTLGIYEIAPPRLVGAFNGARLMIMACTNALSSLVVGYLLDRYGASPVLGAGAILHIVTGSFFWYGFRRKGRTPRA